MAHQWKAGDLAVKVRRKRRPGYTVTPSCVQHRPPYGRPCRVVSVTVSKSGKVGLILDGYPTPGNLFGWAAYCFEPILPAEPAFTQAMRSLKPSMEA